MTDMEFDEIDKAVTSVLGDAPEDTNTEADQTISSRGTSSSDIHVRSVPVTSTSVRSQLAPAQRRSSGRFMDVVHPSSDMKVTPKPADSNDSKPVYAYPSGAVKSNEDIVLGSPAATEPLQENLEPNEPMNTPFLSDAKVEKRPLGAFSEAPAPDSIDEPQEVVETSPETPAEAPVESSQEEATLPAELTDDVMDLDSQHTPEDVPVSGETQEVVSAEPFRPPAEEIAPPVPSIVQQYQEQPSSGSDQSGAIFDTEQYHAPLAHGPKKKSGWLVVLWILALIVLGGGLGAAAYYFVLPNIV